MSHRSKPCVECDSRFPAGKRLKGQRSPRRHSLKLQGEIELLRMRVAAAESLLEKAREHASRAKRRRKLEKLLAKRARKDAKQAKANLADARADLARAEAALIIDDNLRTARRRMRRTKRVARSATPTASKRPATLWKRRNLSGSTPPAPATPPAVSSRLEENLVRLDAGTAQTSVPALEALTMP